MLLMIVNNRLGCGSRRWQEETTAANRPPLRKSPPSRPSTLGAKSLCGIAPPKEQAAGSVLPIPLLPPRPTCRNGQYTSMQQASQHGGASLRSNGTPGSSRGIARVAHGAMEWVGGGLRGRVVATEPGVVVVQTDIFWDKRHGYDAVCTCRKYHRWLQHRKLIATDVAEFVAASVRRTQVILIARPCTVTR